jgi:hypothetical protein
MEAEYNAFSTCMCDALPFKRLVDTVSCSIGIMEETLTWFQVTVWEDNIGALTLVNMEPKRMTPRSKFYAIHYH